MSVIWHLFRHAWSFIPLLNGCRQGKMFAPFMLIPNQIPPRFLFHSVILISLTPLASNSSGFPGSAGVNNRSKVPVPDNFQRLHCVGMRPSLLAGARTERSLCLLPIRPIEPFEQGTIREHGEPMDCMEGSLSEKRRCQPNNPSALFISAAITSLYGKLSCPLSQLWKHLPIQPGNIRLSFAYFRLTRPTICRGAPTFQDTSATRIPLPHLSSKFEKKCV